MKLSVTEYLAVAAAFFGAVFATNYLFDHRFKGIAANANAQLSVSSRSDDEFACPSPTHHDGDAIRCGFMGRSMRLYAIDAPEMPGACRPGRDCTPGDPYAARDHLAALTRGQTVTCRQIDTDHYDPYADLRRVFLAFLVAVDRSG